MVAPDFSVLDEQLQTHAVSDRRSVWAIRVLEPLMVARIKHARPQIGEMLFGMIYCWRRPDFHLVLKLNVVTLIEGLSPHQDATNQRIDFRLIGGFLTSYRCTLISCPSSLIQTLRSC